MNVPDKPFKSIQKSRYNPENAPIDLKGDHWTRGRRRGRGPRKGRGGDRPDNRYDRDIGRGNSISNLLDMMQIITKRYRRMVVKE